MGSKEGRHGQELQRYRHQMGVGEQNTDLWVTTGQLGGGGGGRHPITNKERVLPNPETILLKLI